MSRSLLLALSLGMFSPASLQPGNLPPQQLPVYGGSGGTAFSRNCGAGKVLTGLRARSGAMVDAVGILCRPVLSNGSLGPESTVGTLAGGGGGASETANCGLGQVVTSAKIKDGGTLQPYVRRIAFRCRAWDRNSRKVTGSESAAHVINQSDSDAGNDERCEAPTQPANGIRGRAASFVDAIGFICDEP
jgi:hypothetical protein